MDPILAQFLNESRDGLQRVGQLLMALESQPADDELLAELFRLVHTMKGNSGLFDFPEMTLVLHAGEDLMVRVRDGQQAYTQLLADTLLQMVDFLDLLFGEIEQDGQSDAAHRHDATRLAAALRALISQPLAVNPPASVGLVMLAPPPQAVAAQPPFDLAGLPEAQRMALYRQLQAGGTLYAIRYQPDEACFFQGLDPLHQAMHTPGLQWGGVAPREAWPALDALDAYRCVLDFMLLSEASRDELDDYFRYTPDAVTLDAVAAWWLVLPQGDHNGGPVYDDFLADAVPLLQQGDMAGLQRSVRALLGLSNPSLWLSSALRWLLLVLETEPDNTALLQALLDSVADFQPPRLASQASGEQLQAAECRALLAVQQQILSLPVNEAWHLGRLRAVCHSLQACLALTPAQQETLQQAQALAEAGRSGQPLLDWLQPYLPVAEAVSAAAGASAASGMQAAAADDSLPALADGDAAMRRQDGGAALSRTLRVDQDKVDRLVNLVGEMVVAKNALPYLAQRAEADYACRELARDIKSQYVVINRIAEEMQDAVLQVRMLPVSSVLQRFPRLVRDLSRRLGKEVRLVMSGEETAADKNIIEALADPLIHIVRNSLDHGLEPAAERTAAGKPAQGTLTIRAQQEADRVLIDIIDDGRGIDPDKVKHKAYQRGLIDEATLERLSDQAAINLVFAAGFSTAEAVSDLSGRGVGMDVVRSAIEKVNGTVQLQSQPGKGTQLRLSLPLSIAISQVMVIRSDGQLFGVPMDAVVETVRVPRKTVHTIKSSMAVVLRGRIVPLKVLNTLLGLAAPPLANDDDELAVLLVRLGDEVAGLVVDEFHETASVIIKPLSSVLAGLAGYAGSALMGDGSVLMVLNVKELL